MYTFEFECGQRQNSRPVFDQQQPQKQNEKMFSGIHGGAFNETWRGHKTGKKNTEKDQIWH